MRSALKLAKPESLTLETIFEHIKLPRTRLVVMSACETGLVDPGDLAAEYVGLPAGFVMAGVPSVVSSLWAVDDMSTALLMERFYANHEDGMALPAALRAAQFWLRDVPAGELAARFEAERRKPKHERSMPYEQVSAAWQRFNSLQPDERPFAHPVYWAAFTFSDV